MGGTGLEKPLRGRLPDGAPARLSRRHGGYAPVVRSAIALSVLASALLVSEAAAGTPATRLAISVYPNGTGDSSTLHRYRLECGPAGGTVPRHGRACRVLAALADPFARLGAHTVCAQVIDGPQEAFVTGVL